MVQDSEVVENKVAGNASEQHDEIEVITYILNRLSRFDHVTRERILHAVATFYGITLRGISSAAKLHSTSSSSASIPDNSFSVDRSISPKQFLLEKQPKTDVEKVACLGYYLTHYRDTLHFKTLDISKLNTEAAQVKFSNAAVAVDNAVKRRYLVPATRGNKQLSALGEQYVQALPDREKAWAIMASGRPRKKGSKSKKQSDQD